MTWNAVVLAMLVAPAAARAAQPVGDVTLLHWWTSPSERAAVDALIAVFEKKHAARPAHATLVDAQGGGARMFATVRAAASAGNPPDAFQVHAGAPLRAYFDAGLLSPIDKIWAEEGLEKVVPPIIRSMSAIDGHYYSIPINVHRNNLLWYNKPLLDKQGIDPASLATWEALFAAAEKLKTAGVRSPLQMGDPTTMAVAFESMMASQGAAAYEDWINGKITAADDPRLLTAFTTLRSYLAHANPDHATTRWNVAVQRVIRGETALLLLGDWANGEFRLARQTYGKDYGAVPAPGTKGFYGAAIDAFARASGPAGAASDQLIRTAASREGQDAFNAAKGSIPARNDADIARYDPYQRSAIADLKAAKVVYPNLAGATHDAFKLGVDNVMAAFAEDLDVKKAAAAMALAASRSERKFPGGWSLR